MDNRRHPRRGGGPAAHAPCWPRPDHGSAYWDEENNEGWFYFGDNRVVIKFADNSVTVNDVAVDVDAVDVIAGVTYMSADVFEGWEGYTVAWGDPTAEGFQSVSITTPNNDPAVKLAYEIQELCSMGFGMQADEQTLTDAYGIPAGSFEQVAAFFPMITSPDTRDHRQAGRGSRPGRRGGRPLETYRQGQEDTFSWYLSQNLPKVQGRPAGGGERLAALPHRRQRRRRRGGLPGLVEAQG